jgi:hypothetical protein
MEDTPIIRKQIGKRLQSPGQKTVPIATRWLIAKADRAMS